MLGITKLDYDFKLPILNFKRLGWYSHQKCPPFLLVQPSHQPFAFTWIIPS